MRKFLCAILCLAIACFIVQSGSALAIDETVSSDTIARPINEKIYSNATLEDDFAEDRVLVVLSNTASLAFKDYNATDFSEIQCKTAKNLSQAACNIAKAQVKGIDPVSVLNVEKDNLTFKNFYSVDLDTFNQVLCLEIENKGKQNVLDAIKTLMLRDDVIYAGPDYVLSLESTTPNDPYYADQWAPEKIQLPEAWDISTGAWTLRIGIIDTGIDDTHPDLSYMVLTNLSRDFTSGTVQSVSEVTDPHGHGTAVAGVVAARGNNGVGMTGVAWKTRLASLRVVDDDGSGYTSNVALAINYATEKGFPILNCSLGWYAENKQYDAAFDSVIQSYPGLFICSAGNRNIHTDLTRHYPSTYSCENIIAVGASTQNDRRWADSNYGNITVDLFAPGENILTCAPIQQVPSGYIEVSGTSVAAPHVTGVAALILAKYPDATAQEVKELIMDNVDEVYDSSNTNIFGYCCDSGGRLNAYKALNSGLSSLTDTE